MCQHNLAQSCEPVLFGSLDRETRDVAARPDASRQSQRPRIAQDLAQRPIELETWLRKLGQPDIQQLATPYADEVFKKDVAEKRRLSQKKSAEIHSEDSDRRESRVMTTSTNSVLIGGAGPGAPMAPAVAVKPMSVDEKNRAIRARAVAEAKK